MARVLPFPVDLSNLVDEIKKDDLNADIFSVVNGAGYMPEVFDYSYLGTRGQSALVARRQAAEARADAIGGVVFEYVYPTSQSRMSTSGIYGYSVVVDESELRDRLAVYHVMTS